MAKVAWFIVVLCFSLCQLASAQSCSGSSDVEQIVGVLTGVTDFEGLAGWLNLGNKVHVINGNCDNVGDKVKCRCRQLVDIICQEKGLHNTVEDLANVLEHNMSSKKQADDLRALAPTLPSSSCEDKTGNLWVDPSTPTCQSSLPPAVSKYAEFLRATYDITPATAKDKLHFKLSEEYVTLALVKNEIRTQREADEFTRLTLRGDVDQILAVKEPIELKDIFNPEEKTRLVLVEGAPGIGKSTLALELCHQWQKRTLLQQFSLVILLILREQEVFTATGIRDLFPHYYNENLRDEVVDEVIRNIGEGVLFIFDGFDELPSQFKKKSFISEMIRRSDLLPKATIMVTSRPSASAELQPLLETTFKRIEIVGFRKDVIMSAARSAFNSTEVFSNFQTYLKTNPYVEELMYNPLSCAIVVKIYSENFQAGRSVPQTLTQLYTEFTMYLISRHFKEKGEESVVNKLPNTLEGFKNEHEDIYQELLSIGYLAVIGWIIERDVFDSLHGNSTTDLGLLIEYRSLFERNEVVRYTFFHRTLQEYMVAFYISQFGYYERLKHHLKTILYPRNYVILKFYAGLTKMKYVGWDVLGSYRLIVESFFEANDVKECNNAFDQKRLHVKDKCLPPHTMYTNGYAISVCDIISTFNLSQIAESGLEMLNHGLNQRRCSQGSIHTLILTSSYGILNHGGHWLQMPQYIIEKIEILIFDDCEINPAGFQTLSLHIRNFISLAMLGIQHNPGGRGLVNFLWSLKSLNKLKYLFLEDVEMGTEDISALSNLIVSSSQLVVIIAGGWATSTIQTDAQLANTLLLPSSLNEVTIKFMSRSYNNSSILEYIDVVSNNVKLLGLHDVSPPNSSRLNNWNGIFKFRHVLRNNTSLVKLEFLFDFNDWEIPLLLLLLNENKSLETIKYLKDEKIHILSKNGAQFLCVCEP